MVQHGANCPWMAMIRDAPDVVVVVMRCAGVGSRRKNHQISLSKETALKKLGTCPGAAPVQEVRGRVAHARKKLRYWFCGETGNLKRRCPRKIGRGKLRKPSQEQKKPIGDFL